MRTRSWRCSMHFDRAYDRVDILINNCRHRHALPSGGVAAGGVAQDRARQPRRDMGLHAAGRAADDQGRTGRQHRQHQFDCREFRAGARQLRLQRDEGGHHPVHARIGGRVGAVQDSRQRHPARADDDAGDDEHAPRPATRPGDADLALPARHPARPDRRAGGHRPRLPSSSPRTARASSPATRCRWMAATSPSTPAAASSGRRRTSPHERYRIITPLAFVGAGALGQSFAGLLAKNGQAVTLLATPRTAAALLAAGRIRLRGVVESTIPAAPAPAPPGSVGVTTDPADLPAGGG